MADSTIRIDVQFDGAEEAASEASTLGNRLEGLGDKATRGGQQFGQMAGAVGNATNALSTLNPAMARTAGIIGQIGTAASGLSGSMGVLGVTLGGVAAAAGVMGLAVAEARRQLDSLNSAADRLNARLASTMDRMLRAQALARQTQRLMRGGGTTGEQEAFTGQQAARRRLIEQALGGDRAAIAALRRQRGSTTGAITAGSVAGGVVSTLLGESNPEFVEQAPLEEGERDLLRDLLDQSRRRESQAISGEQIAANRGGQSEEDAERAERSSRRRGGGRRRTPRLSGADELAKAQTRAAGEEAAAAEAEEERLDQIRAQFALDHLDRVAERETAELDAIKEIQQAEMDRAEEAFELQVREREKAEEESTRAMESLQAQADEFQEFTQPILTGLVDAFTAIAAGTETAEEAFSNLLASFLSFVAEKAAVEAAAEYAAAIASFAAEQYDKGALHLAAGAAWTGVAVAAGVASGAVAGGSGAAPTNPGRDSGNRGESNQTVVVNLTGSVVTAGTRAELGRELGGLVAEGTRRFEGRV